MPWLASAEAASARLFVAAHDHPRPRKRGKRLAVHGKRVASIVIIILRLFNATGGYCWWLFLASLVQIIPILVPSI